MCQHGTPRCSPARAVVLDRADRRRVAVKGNRPVDDRLTTATPRHRRGGTGGHVLPALAVVEELRRRPGAARRSGSAAPRGSSGKAAAWADIPFDHPHRKLRRYASVETLVDAVRLPIGALQAGRHLREFRPAVVFSTGGFVSVPTVFAARHIAPILTHEQTAILGLANRINARYADTVAVSYEATAPLAAAPKEHPRRVVVTGNPVWVSLNEGDAARGLARWGWSAAEVAVLDVTGGARGGSPVNRRIAALLPEMLERCQSSTRPGRPRRTGTRRNWLGSGMACR